MSTLEPFPEDWSAALAVAAHPDDLEYGSAAAVARWTAQGKTVTYLLVTDGEAGIEGMEPERCGPLRREEEIRGAAEVGVHTVEFLGRPDGQVEADLGLRRDLAAAIRRHRPELLLSINFRDSWGGHGWNHVDHRNVGIALLDAARDAGNTWMFTDLLDEGLEAWSGVRMVAFGGSTPATHGVDVTDTIDRGVASLEAHRAYLDGLGAGTQGTDPDAFCRGAAASAGPALGVELATTFEVISVDPAPEPATWRTHDSVSCSSTPARSSNTGGTTAATRSSRGSADWSPMSCASRRSGSASTTPRPTPPRGSSIR